MKSRNSRNAAKGQQKMLQRTQKILNTFFRKFFSFSFFNEYAISASNGGFEIDSAVCVDFEAKTVDLVNLSEGQIVGDFGGCSDVMIKVNIKMPLRIDGKNLV